MEILYPAKRIKKPHFSGKLLIDGDFGDNCILFRFLFDSEEMVHPLLVWTKIQPIKALRNRSRRSRRGSERIIVFECNIPDYNNPLMKSSIIFPEFLLRKQKIRVVNIESQVSCRPCGSPCSIFIKDIDGILKNNVKCGRIKR